MQTIRFRDITVVFIFFYVLRALASQQVFNDEYFRLYLLSELTFNLALVLGSIVVLKLDRSTLRQIVGIRPAGRHLYWAGILGVAFFLLEPGTQGIMAHFSTYILPEWTRRQWPFWMPFSSTFANSANVICNIVIASVFVPIAEEFVFRGLILGQRFESKNFRSLAVISSIIFTLLHFEKSQWLSTFAISLSLAYLYRRSRSLVTCVLAHSITNLLAFTHSYFFAHWFVRSFDEAGQFKTWWLEFGFFGVSSALIILWMRSKETIRSCQS